MSATASISLVQLLTGLLLLLIPCAIFVYYGTGLLRATLIAALRMVVQLFMVGFYLRYLFEWNSPWVNILWMLVMVAICSVDILRHTKLKARSCYLPLYSSVVLVLVFCTLFFLKAVLGLDSFFESRYFIPTCGMILGNQLTTSILGLNTFYDQLHTQKTYYYSMVAQGATRSEAMRPFIRHALQRSFRPMIATMAIMGLISLPGTLVGQILGGSPPDTAARYQIMIMVLLISSTPLTLVINIQWSLRSLVDEWGRLRDD